MVGPPYRASASFVTHGQWADPGSAFVSSGKVRSEQEAYRTRPDRDQPIAQPSKSVGADWLGMVSETVPALKRRAYCI
jgi:hypothetical protein